MEPDLTPRHRETLQKIFTHPTSGNVEWREVTSLLEAIGSTPHERNGKVTVALGSQTTVLQRPRGKDVDEQMIVDLRRMLTAAGFGPI
jgi:hypothetical protein